MRVKQSAVVGIVLGWVILLAPAEGAIVIEPTNVVLPGLAGETFSFDYAINDAMGRSAAAYQSRMSVSGPGTLTLDITASEAVADNPDYWLSGGTGLGAVAKDIGGGVYDFWDSPLDAVGRALSAGDIMARYSFTWDGTPGDYTFTLVSDTYYSFILNASYVKEALQFTPGQYPGQGDSFTVTIPEPSTMLLLALGGAGLLKRRRR
jgi:hypothetical protein